jgi:uncharacterized protein (TIGR02611 family)
MEVNSLNDRIRRWLAPLPRPLRRMLVLLIGSTVLMAGALMLVLPGPGILVIIVGLAILAIEFAWAEALLIRARGRAERLAGRFRVQKDRRG